MNKEIIKAMNVKKEIKISKWFKKNSYKISKVIFFPLYFGYVIKEKYIDWRNSKIEWNEDRANSILQYYIPRRAKWIAEKKIFYFFDNGYGWFFKIAKKHLKRKDYNFWKIYNHKIRIYLINNFNLEGFSKEVLDCSDWTEIEFTLNEK